MVQWARTVAERRGKSIAIVTLARNARLGTCRSIRTGSTSAIPPQLFRNPKRE
jgi:hypothetical protein